MHNLRNPRNIMLGKISKTEKKKNASVFQLFDVLELITDDRNENSDYL